MNYHCDHCGRAIAEAVIERRHYSQKRMPQHIFCGKGCRDEWQVEHQHHKLMSLTGRAARSQAVSQSNRIAPRRAKHSK